MPYGYFVTQAECKLNCIATNIFIFLSLNCIVPCNVHYSPNPLLGLARWQLTCYFWQSAQISPFIEATSLHLQFFVYFVFWRFNASLKIISDLLWWDHYFIYFFYICHIYAPFTRKRILSLYFGRAGHRKFTLNSATASFTKLQEGFRNRKSANLR